MITLVPDEVDSINGSGDAPPMVHYYCECSPNLGRCGAPLQDDEIYEVEDPLDCVVCDAMVDLPCPHCGI